MDAIHVFTDDSVYIARKINGEIIVSSPQNIKFGDTEVIPLPQKISVHFPNDNFCCLVSGAEDLLYDFNLEVKSEVFYPSEDETVVAFTVIKHCSEEVILPRLTPLASLTFVSHVNNRVAFHKTKSDFLIDVENEDVAGGKKDVSWNLSDTVYDECDCSKAQI